MNATNELEAINVKQPAGDELFLDHVGYFVADLDTAARQLERLGFCVSQTNIQNNANEKGELVPTGTSNRLVMLNHGFLEALAATSKTPLADQLLQALARYQGLHLIALAHADMDSQYRRLIAAGFPMQPSVTLRRWVPTADGQRQTGISVLRTKPGAMAEGRIQMVTNHTPELFWKPGTTLHANRADAITDILLCVTDIAEATQRYSDYTGRRVDRVGAYDEIKLDHGRLALADLDRAKKILPGLAVPSQPYMAGIALRSADIAATRTALTREGIELFFENETLLCVSPDDAIGSYLLFHAASIERPWLSLAQRFAA